MGQWTMSKGPVLGFQTKLSRNYSPEDKKRVSELGRKAGDSVLDQVIQKQTARKSGVGLRTDRKKGVPVFQPKLVRNYRPQNQSRPGG